MSFPLPPPPRPYTSYNLFFQLEREYILQTLHGHRPNIAPENIFDSTADTYPADAPALPARYASLVLPYDWHIPGKTRRRKRSHRKSHGKIGFHELNDRISKAWSEADDEVRDFCALLSDIESVKYKRVKVKKIRQGKTKKKKAAKSFRTSDLKIEGADLFPSFDWTANFANFNLENDSFSPAKIAPKKRIVDMDIDNLTRSTASLRGSLTTSATTATTIAEVDMEDNDILDIWETTRVSNDEPCTVESILSASQVCLEVGTFSDSGGAQKDGLDDARSSFANSKRGKFLKDPSRHAAAARAKNERGKERDDGRTSFIDAEYEKYQEIGKMFPKARPGGLNKNTFNACQA